MAYETTVPGIFAVGDVRHRSVKRVASAVGEGSTCISLVHDYSPSSSSCPDRESAVPWRFWSAQRTPRVHSADQNDVGRQAFRFLAQALTETGSVETGRLRSG
jgi:hypothetical protein